MTALRSALAGLLALLTATAAVAQTFPTVPYHTVIGRLGVPGDTGPSQAIPFATLNASLFNSLCTTSGAFPIYNATTSHWVCSTAGGTGSLANLTGTLGITASGINLGINIQQTGSGSLASALGYNLIHVASDNVAISGSNFGVALNVDMDVGGSSLLGGREAIQGSITVGSASSASNTIRNYVGIQGIGAATSADNGTNTGAGAAGALFGGGLWGDLQSGATNWLNLTALEADVSARTGSTIKYKAGIQVVSHALDAVAGASVDAGIVITKQTGGIGFLHGIDFSDMSGDQPVKATGTLIGTSVPNAKSLAAANGIDFTAYAFSGLAFTSTNFSVDGVGLTSASSFVGSKLSGGAAVGSSLTLQSTLAAGTTDFIKFVVGNAGAVEAMRIMHDGGIGIGTTTSMGPNTVNLIAGTLANASQALFVSGTQPTVPVATQNGVVFNITSAGSAAQTNQAFITTYFAGYTGASVTAAGGFNNQVAGTGSTLIPASGGNGVVGNIGQISNTTATTTGLNIGVGGKASGGDVNAGLVGVAQLVKNSAKNIGVVGSAINTGTTPVQVGGWFSLNQTTLPTVSAALIADNGAQTDPIARFRDNGTDVVVINDGGALLSVNATAGLGYGTGAGGTVTQGAGSGKATAVTLNTVTGAITMNNAALAAATIVSFVLTDSAIAATDYIASAHESGGTTGAYTINCRATGAGTAACDVRNNTAGSLSEAIVIRFWVHKSVNS